VTLLAQLDNVIPAKAGIHDGAGIFGNWIAGFLLE
jgi:hypothetical protein